MVAATSGLLTELLDAVGAPVLVFDESGRCIDANGCAADAFGVGIELMVGLDVWSVVRGASDEHIVAHVRDEVFVHGRGAVIELDIVGHAGGAFRMAARVRPVRLDGEALAVATLARVETANTAAEGLRHARELQGDVLDVLPTPVLVAHADDIVFANPAALRLLGVDTLGEAQARERARAHVHPDEVPLLEARRAARARGVPVAPTVQYQVVRPDGSTRIAAWSTLHVNFGGRPAHLHTVTDLTEISEARDVLARSEDQRRAVFEALAEGVIVVDRVGRCVSANPAAATLLGVDAPESLVGLRIDRAELIDPATADPIDPHEHAAVRALAGSTIERTIVAVHLTHGTRVLQVSARPLPNPADGPPLGAVITFSDVTEQRRAAVELAANEERYRNLTSLAPVGIFETDADGRCRFVNPHWCQLTGLAPAEAMGDGWTRAIDPPAHAAIRARWSAATERAEPCSFEIPFRRPDGTKISTLCTANPLRDPIDGTLTGWLGTLTDVTEQHLIRDQLQTLAHQDPLTGLLNRRALLQALQGRSGRNDRLAVLFCDLDGFKSVNDRYGHDAGDVVLVTLAERFRGAVGPGDLVARLAGDEFVVVVGAERADVVAQRVVELARTPIALPSGELVVVTASVGAAVVGGGGEDDVQDGLRTADAAMYAAKRDGKDRATRVA